MTKQYIAIIGDIMDSKKIKDRAEVQEQLKKTLVKINKEFSDVIASNFKITLGDEFQGLITKNSVILDIINKIELCMYPIKIRFGIGVGEIHSNINRMDSGEIVGPAYYNARNAIEKISNKKRKYENVLSNIYFDSNNEYKNENALINANFSLIYVIKSKWTKAQMRVIRSFVENNYNQYNVAKTLNITQPAVSKLLKVSNFFTIKNAYEKIGEILEKRDLNDNFI